MLDIKKCKPIQIPEDAHFLHCKNPKIPNSKMCTVKNL